LKSNYAPQTEDRITCHLNTTTQSNLKCKTKI